MPDNTVMTTEDLIRYDGEGELLPAQDEVEDIEPYTGATEADPGWSEVDQ